MKYTFNILALILSFLLSASAQEEGNLYHFKDEITLNHGLKIIGQVERFEGDTLFIMLKSGYQVRFLLSQVKKIHLKKSLKEKTSPSENLFSLPESPRRFFFETGSQLLFGGGEFLFGGVGFGISGKYKIADQHLLTLNTGYQLIGSFDLYGLLPMTVGYEFLIKRGHFTPYLFVKGGTSYTREHADYFSSWEVKHSQKYRFRGEVGTGFLIGLKHSLALNLGVSYLYQDIHYKWEWQTWSGQARIVDLTIRRLSFHLGIVF
jgi:hypothetical protein